MLISAIVPVYNEAQTISQVISRLLQVKEISQIVIVDDASTDGTTAILLKIKNPNVKLILHHKNQGKGAAVRTAIPHLKHPLTLIQDADLEYHPQDIGKLLKKSSPNVAVFGSRLLHNPFPERGYVTTLLGNHFVTLLANVLFNTRLTDSYTCYKLLPTRILKSLDLKSNGFEIEAEITAKLAKKKVKIIEVPISYRPRSYQKGKKIKPRDFFKAISTLISLN